MENFEKKNNTNKEVDMLNDLQEIFSNASSNNDETDNDKVIEFVNEITGDIKTPNLELTKLGAISNIEVFQSGILCYRVGAGGGFISINPLTMRPYIVVDDSFSKLTNTSKAFVLLHEIGHYKNGDFKIMRGNKLDGLKNKLGNVSERVKLRAFKTYPERETYADYFAMSHLNSLDDSLNALDEIIECLTSSIKEKIDYIENVGLDITNKKKVLKSLNKALDFHLKSNAIRKKKLEYKFYNGPYFIDKEHNTELD